ncbi:MAG: hypothetical protein WCD79_20240 [Chthoniobacteraceae bacterium]
MQTDFDKVAAVRAAMPAEGLFADKEWMISPEPFAIDERLMDELEKLGHRLNLFNRACNLLYHMSVQGKQPGWVADYLDLGKPPELVEYSRQRRFRDDVSQVIRPDIILTEPGPDGRPAFTIAELDTVPGGIGLTAWLNQTYASFGTHDILGGADGMIEGFRSIMPEGDIVISAESGTYRPEMLWLARQARKEEGLRDEGGGRKEEALRVMDAEGYELPPEIGKKKRRVYRFFELFDLPNIASSGPLMRAALAGDVTVTPPIKPYLEEKMWFALFWMRPLREFWRRELGEKHWLRLQQFIPYTWIVDPTPIPQHAVIPELNIHSWEELAHFSQKQRDLIMKVSGFSELGWGSRGVSLGADMPQQEWKAAVDRAQERFRTEPRILQRFHKGRLVAQRYLNPATGQIETMHGRVRLCPYYFIINNRAELRGALATVCPADKKLLHGMKDAILVPGAVVVN